MRGATPMGAAVIEGKVKWTLAGKAALISATAYMAGSQ
jgi:hypothetical protein